MSLARAQSLMAAGRFAEAHSEIDRVSQSDSARHAIVKSRIYEAEWNFQAAIAVLDDAASKQPGYAPLYLHRGFYQWDSDNHPQARADFEKVLQLDPKNELAGSYLALARLAQGERDSSINMLTCPGISDNRMFLVRLTEWVEQEWIARDRFFHQQPTQVDDLIARYAHLKSRRRRESKAEKLFYKKQFRDIIALMDPIVESGKLEEGDVFGIAFAAEMLNDYDRANSVLETLSQGPEEVNEALRAVKARVRLRQRCFVEAAELMRNILMVGPDDFGINYALGVMCLAFGDRRRARGLFFRAYTDYVVDTLEWQFWKLQQALCTETSQPGS